MKATEQVSIGYAIDVTKTVTDADIQKFAEATGDFNPLHLDEDAAKKTIFGGRIAHGILTVGFVSAALARLPGVVVYMKLSVQFLRPVKIGDTVTARIEVTGIIPEKSEVDVKAACTNQRGEIVLTGESRVKLLDFKQP